MKEGLVFGSLDKVSDDILFFGSGVTLRFNVVLSRKKEDDTRDFMHKEYGYPSKYLDHEYSYTIRRSFDFYLSIDIKDNFDDSIQIRAKDMIILRTRLNEIIRWFGELFKLKDKKLRIIGNYTPIIIGNLSGKWIKFIPIVIDYDNMQREGIRMILNSESTYVDVHIDRFMEFIYYISSMDMYQCALSVLSYFNPEIGKDVVYFDNKYQKPENPNLKESEEETQGFGKVRPQLKQQQQTHPTTRQKSFFDKDFEELDKL